MENKVVNKDEEKIVLNVEMKADEWEKSLQEAYEKLKGKYNIEGFRKGKAPRKVIENFYGENVFYEEAFNKTITDFYINYLQENKDVKPLKNYPEFTIDEIGKDGYKVTMTITLTPKVTLGEYKGLEVKKVVHAVSEKDVDHEIEHMLASQAKQVDCEDADKVLENGDIAVIDFDGTIDGERFDGGMAEDYPLEIGSHSFIDNFEEQMLGMKKGDTKDIKVTFPKNYGAKNLAGKDAVFYVTVKEIKQKQIPELTDEFAKSMGEFEDAKALRAFIKSALEKQAQTRSQHETENALVDKIVANSQVKIPDEMVEAQLDAIMHDLSYRLMYQGITLEQYADMMQTTVDKIRQEKKADAENAVRTRLVLEEIIEKEDLKISQEEIDAKIQELALNAHKNVDEFKKSLPNQQLDYIINDIIVNKLYDFLAKENKFVD